MDCSTKDSVWVVGISSSIVFQGIVLALFQSAVTRWKCVHTALLQAFLCMVSGSILWYSVGFSLSFGRSQKGFIGDLDNAFFIQVSHINSSSNAPTISSMALATFEVVLASIGPVMVITTWCQQVALLGSLIVFLLWPLLVYYPITHWARGGGWLEDMGLVDQGGSLTLHVSAGTSALVFTRMLRPYVSTRSTDETRNHHYASQEATFLLVGVLMIWGWFAINIGSGYRMDGTIALSSFNTYMSANVSAMCWFVVVYITRRTVNFVDLMSGVIAGIVGCSACSGSIESWASILTGFLVGSMSSAIQCCVRNHFPWWTNGSKFDVTYIHGIPGIVGALMAGLTTKSSLGGAVNNGAFYSNSKQLGVQMLGVLMCVVWPLLWTYFITWFVHFTVGFSLNSAVVVEESFYSDQVLAQVHPCHVIDAAQIFQAASDGDDRQLEALSHKPGVSFNFKNFDRRTPLHEAASRGHLECVKFLLRQPGVDIHSRDRWKNTSLSEAIRFGHDHVVHCLIRHGASWEEDGAGNILCTAVARNDMDELKRLLSLGVEANTANADGRTALHLAAILGSRGLIQYLIDQGADINAVDSYGNASLNYSDMHEHRAVSQLLESLGAKRLSHHYITHEICEAAGTGNLQMLRHMVHNGAVISYRDTNKRTPLHVSAAEGYLDVVKFLLLQPGIDINARDRDDVTPLLEAVIHEHDLVAEHLKSHGGGITEGKLAELMNNSARSGDVRNLKRFVRWLGHVNICDNDGRTPLHTAVQHDRVTMVTMLLKEGADCNLVDRYGKTPLQVACSRHHGAIENELRKYVQPQAHSRITDVPENFFLHHRANRKRRRKRRTGPSSYAYSKRESWSSRSDNSTEIHKTLPKNAVNQPRTNGTTKSDNELNDISNCKPPFFRGATISSLTSKAREMTGGQPDYV